MLCGVCLYRGSSIPSFAKLWTPFVIAHATTHTKYTFGSRPCLPPPHPPTPPDGYRQSCLGGHVPLSRHPSSVNQTSAAAAPPPPPRAMHTHIRSLALSFNTDTPCSSITPPYPPTPPHTHTLPPPPPHTHTHRWSPAVEPGQACRTQPSSKQCASNASSCSFPQMHPKPFQYWVKPVWLSIQLKGPPLKIFWKFWSLARHC